MEYIIASNMIKRCKITAPSVILRSSRGKQYSLNVGKPSGNRASTNWHLANVRH